MIIPMVKAYVINQRLENPKPTPRLIPEEVYQLWKHLMESRHQFKIVSEQNSVWIDEKEYSDNLEKYHSKKLAKVRQITLIPYDSKFGVTSLTTRYFPEENYFHLRKTFLEHFPATQQGNMQIREVDGYYIENEE